MSEPIQLALKLYEVIDALKNAPNGAKAFASKVKSFSRALEALDETLKNGAEIQASDQLHVIRAECWDCVKRCEEFSEPFKDLTREGRGGMINAGQRLRLVWQEKKVGQLGAQIDDQVAIIGLSLHIKNLSVSECGCGSNVTPNADDR